MTLCAAAVFVVAYYLTRLFDDTLFCGRDVAVQWSQTDGACSVFYAGAPFIPNYALGLSCYLVTYVISVRLLCKGTLNLRWSQGRSSCGESAYRLRDGSLRLSQRKNWPGQPGL